ncbi:MAG: hypothetical protein U9Q83_01920 [Bacteroidota bacterium]|nr:hypothetical protein [Bacteroidota bacterium]
MGINIFNKSNKSTLSTIFKKISYAVSVDEFIDFLPKKDLKIILKIDYKKFDKNFLTKFFTAYYNYYKNLYSESLINSFSVIEFLIRNEYAKTATNNEELKNTELLKWARNRDIISVRFFNYLQGIRQARNKITHNMKTCLPEESKLALVIATQILSDFSEK